MEDEQVKGHLDALEAEVTRRIGERATAGDSAGSQRLSECYTSLSVMSARLLDGDAGTPAGGP